MRDIINWGLNSKISPFTVYRKAPNALTFKIAKGMAKRRFLIDDCKQLDIMAFYLCQIFKMGGTYEYALMNLFTSGLRAQKGLAAKSRLGDEDFSVPFSFVYGDVDWVKSIDRGASEELIALKKQHVGSDNDNLYTCIIVPDSDHNLHFDNPIATTNAILNIVLGKDLPIKTRKEYGDAIGPFKHQVSV